MDRNDLRRELRAMLNGLCGEDVFLDPAAGLLETGLLDSLARVEWRDLLEDGFGSGPQPTQIPPEVWRRAEALASFCADYYAADDSSGSGVS